MKKKSCWLGFQVMFCLCLGGMRLGGADIKKPNMNVLLITLDTVRADYIGAYGHAEIKTPNIDRLCREGVMFGQAYTPVPLTLPAHASILTGKYPIGHNVRINGRYRLADEQVTLAEILKQQGYQTHAAIASYVLMSKFGTQQGFDVYDDNLEGEKMYSTVASEIPADRVYGKFKSWFASHYGKKFFSWVHFYDAHVPYNPPGKFLKSGSETDDKKRYAGEIEYVDSYVGKIIQDLSAKKKLDDTLIVIVGDHGEAFGEHMEFGHSAFCYEQNLHVPMVFYSPKILPASIVDTPVSLVDILPTVLDVLKIAQIPDVQGESLLPLLLRTGELPERTLYFESMWGKEENNWAPLMGVFDKYYKYINLPDGELYDLKNDKQEKVNLYRKEPGLAREYDAKLQVLLARFFRGDQGGAKRDLSGQDLKKLESLGYISSSSAKTKGQIDPKRGIILYNKMERLGKQVTQGKDLDAAEQELKAILQKTPELKNSGVYDLLFRIYHARADHKAARAICDQGIVAFPDCVQLRDNLVICLAALKKFDEVAIVCQDILKLDPLFTHAHLVLGEYYDKTADAIKAVEHYKQAVDLEPENISLRLKYAELLLKYELISDALAAYNLLVDNEALAKNHELLYKVAILNSRFGTLDRAEQIFERILKTMPCAKYHFYFAMILGQNGKFARAVLHMDTALNKYAAQLSPQQLQQGRQALETWKKKY